MDQIFDLAFHGQGGFSFTEVYNLPVNIRSYYYFKLAKIIEERNAQMEASKRK